MDTEFLIRDAYRLGVKKTEHDRFAIITRDEGGAYLNLTLTFCNAEAAILRPIRDVELHPREELDARVELVVGGGVEEIRVGQDAVNAEAQESPLFSRLKVDVRRAQCKRSRADDFVASDKSLYRERAFSMLFLDTRNPFMVNPRPASSSASFAYAGLFGLWTAIESILAVFAKAAVSASRASLSGITRSASLSIS